MEPLLLGIDIGTSACKAALFTPDGVVVAQEAAGYDVLYPHPGWAEQNPDDWWAAFGGALHDAAAAAGVQVSDIDAISVGAQCHGLVAMDGNGRVLRPVKLWNDTTSAPQAAAMKAELLKNIL